MKTLLPCRMNESFELPVVYRGEEFSFPATLLLSGYTHQFVVEVNGMEIFFEPDEEGNYRALTDGSHFEAAKKTDAVLMKAIAEAITGILK